MNYHHKIARDNELGKYLEIILIVNVIDVRIKHILLDQKVDFLLLPLDPVHSIKFREQCIGLLADILEIRWKDFTQKNTLRPRHRLDNEPDF